jgi:hypothetical protein
MKTTVINIKDGGVKYDEYIGRGSQWGNPFKIGKDGNREQVIEMYEKWIVDQDYLMEDIPELKGKILGCHCKPDPCHGDVLVRLADGIEEEMNETPDVWNENGDWYIKTEEGVSICTNTEESAKMLLRLLKKEI